MHYTITVESEGEIILKIGQHLRKLWAESKCVFFSEYSVHRVHKKPKVFFCYNFKRCSQISIKFGRNLAITAEHCMLKLSTSPGVCVHTLPCNVTRGRIVTYFITGRNVRSNF